MTLREQRLGVVRHTNMRGCIDELTIFSHTQNIYKFKLFGIVKLCTANYPSIPAAFAEGLN